MLFDDALKLIQTEFEVRKVAELCYLIKTGLTYDGVNSFFITLYGYGNELILSDTGRTVEILDEVPLSNLENLCNENDFNFVNYKITLKFNGLESVYNYINFMNKLADIYRPL